MARLHIHRCTALTMDNAFRCLEDAAIVIEDARIRYVGTLADAPPVTGEDEVLDAQGMLALPGLINTHTHLAMTLFRGAADDLPLMTWLQEKIWPVEANLTSEDVYWASLLGIAEMLRAGVTTFNDMYWHADAVMDAVRDSGIRGCISAVVLGVVPDADGMFMRAKERVAALAAEGHPRLVPFFGPHAPYTVPPPMLRQIVTYAIEYGVSIHTHLSETRHEVEESLRLHGNTPIALMEELGLFDVHVAAAHCVHPTAEEIDILAARGVGVLHCPTSNAKLGSGIAPVPAMLRAGVTVGVGTDGAGSNNTLSLFDDIKFAALMNKITGDATAVTARDALAMATRGGAAALGLPDLGVLAPGKLADVILVDISAPHLTPALPERLVSHMVYAATGSDVDTVIVHGEVLMRGRALRNLDLPRIRAHVEASARRLFG